MALTEQVRGKRRPPRVVVYGPPKIGKTTLAADTPDPWFIPTADGGIDNLPVRGCPVVRSWEEVLKYAGEVVKEKHEHKTVVVDTLGGAVELAAHYICRTMFNNDFGEKGFLSYGKGWIATSEEIKKLLALLDQCVDRGMMVFVTAHTGVQTVKNPIDGDYSKFCPDLDRKVWGRIAAWTDVILRADFEYSMIITDKKNKRGRVEGTTTRVLRCVGTSAEDAGCRAGYELPDTLPMSWEALSEALGRDVQTLPEVKAKWGLFDKAQQAKAMAWLGIAKLEDAPVGKLRQLLNRLRAIETEREAKKEAVNESA
ncbi:MAG: Uncharacterized protein FD189_1051 [Elusimicrobia bacterium]|nr:MAG: Uncharacterized protein FD189_1051 [Elusimicrobiota bacterium]